MRSEMLIFMLVIMLFQVLGMYIIIVKSFKKVPQGKALVRDGMGGKRVSFNGIMVYPIMHTHEELDITLKLIEIERVGKNALQMKEGERVDGRFSFYIRVNNNETDVLRVADVFGAHEMDEKALPIFTRLFEETITNIAMETTAEDWLKKRVKTKERIISEIGIDLNGFILDDLAIDRVKVH